MGELIKPYKNKGLCETIATDDLTAICDLTITASRNRGGRPAEYPETPEGMEQFIEKTINYFEYVNEVNKNADMERKLIPDIENWAVYLGITRMTICTYSKRSKEWARVIDYYKNAIASVKKQLALNYKIPPMVYVFDATNNHGYVNSAEFKLQNEYESDTNNLDLEQLPDFSKYRKPKGKGGELLPDFSEEPNE